MFLQGPHGPFFSQLSTVLVKAGARVLKVGFNQGDRAFWKDKSSYIAFQGTREDWPEALAGLLAEHQVTDIVLYGDTRPLHAEAVRAAKAANLKIHCFEEGYLRPYWATYERGGVNGYSRLLDLSVDQMRQELQDRDLDLPGALGRHAPACVLRRALSLAYPVPQPWL